MRRQSEQVVVFILLVAATVGLRLYFQEIPNFAPVAAVALFAGFFFRSRWLAILAPVSVMAISDLFVGRYDPWLMVTVYGFLTLPVLMGGPLRRHLAGRGAISSTISLATCGLASSLLFFTATNFMTWVVTPWYSRSLAGLAECYVNAIPFFRYTLAGDLFFAGVLFGSYALARQLASRRATASDQTMEMS